MRLFGRMFALTVLSPGREAKDDQFQCHACGSAHRIQTGDRWPMKYWRLVLESVPVYIRRRPSKMNALR